MIISTHHISMQSHAYSQKGFTLVELLLSIALLTILAGISIPLQQQFQNRNALDVAAVTIAQNMRRAQMLSQAMDGDAQWGVFIQAGSVTLFQGASYATRTTSFDEVSTIADTITLSGTTEYNFAKFSGTLGSSTSLTLTSLNNETRTITTNTKGMVAY